MSVVMIGLLILLGTHNLNLIRFRINTKGMENNGN